MIVAVIPAAGLSSRMGAQLPKPLLPWGPHTVIQQVIGTLQEAGLEQIVVVTGHRRQELEAVLASCPVRCVFNPAYPRGDMLSSVQVGLRALVGPVTGALVALADQPQMRADVVRQLLAAFQAGGDQALVVPSYRMRLGHPIILPRRLWPEVLALPEGRSLRSVIRAHTDEIRYVVVDTPDVLADLDTPEQYQLSVSGQGPRAGRGHRR
jgi:molybdenum cofactor cytidylyltransferase